MNSRQLQKLGVPEHCIGEAIAAIQIVRKADKAKSKDFKSLIKSVVETPEGFVSDKHFGVFAKALIEDRDFVRAEPVDYRTWGDDGIDKESHLQMQQACSVPVATAGALMPDAHVGYGLPIGGVLACENAVIPYAVGVDIACRMKLSVLDIPANTLDTKFNSYKESLEGGTRFGVGSEHEKPQCHAVMDSTLR